MKKTIGFLSGVAAVALAGTGVYMMMSNDTKKHMNRTMNSAFDDAKCMVNDAKNTINKKMN